MSESHSLPLFKFTPFLKSAIWGGDKIARFKRLGSGAPEKLGESWEISAIPGKESHVSEGFDRGLSLRELIGKYGEDLMGAAIATGDFPLLIKLIDATDNLSLQVHPDDAMALRHNQPGGKTEMWYIIDNDPDARIIAGFSKDIRAEDYARRVADDSIMDCVLSHASAPGDVYYIAPGTIHSIGAGNFLIEVQQACDITYRVYDYHRTDASGRCRELHINQAAEALDLKASPVDKIVLRPSSQLNSRTALIKCEKFRVDRLTVEGEMMMDLREADVFHTLTVIAGHLDVKVDSHPYVEMTQGESALVPASASTVILRGNAIAISATV